MMLSQPGLFDPKIHNELNGVEPVLHHEAAHAVTWVVCGGWSDSIRFMRTENGLLGVTNYSDCLQQLEINENNDCLEVERILAGEVAARRVLPTLSPDKICSYEIQIQPSDNIRQVLCKLRRVQQVASRAVGVGGAKLDLVKVLETVQKFNRKDWYGWMEERLNNAKTRVDANWTVIERLASWLKQQLQPLGDQTPVIIEGKTVGVEIKRLGVTPGQSRIQLKPAIKHITAK
jgi:hypothetical protein